MIKAGIEFGYINPTIIMVVGHDDNIVDEFRQAGLTITDVIKEAIRLQDEHNIEVFYADPTQPAYIKEMNKAGLNVVPAKEVKKNEKIDRKYLALNYAYNYRL